MIVYTVPILIRYNKGNRNIERKKDKARQWMGHREQQGKSFHMNQGEVWEATNPKIPMTKSREYVYL